jgi:hypothetical protein
MSCDLTTSFPTATQMAGLSTNLPVVWEEICAIQQAILAASSQCQPGGGKMTVTVGGTSPMTFLAGISAVNVVSGGAGYYTDAPAMVFIKPLGSAVAGAIGTVTTNGGNVLSINIVDGGTGYAPVPATLSVTSVAGLNASLVPLVNAAGNIVAVDIVAAGTGYTLLDTITPHRALAANSAYVNATLQITGLSITGGITSVAITNTGSGYSDSVATVELVSSIGPIIPYPLGVGFTSTVLTDNAGVIIDVLVTNQGAGYATNKPYLVISDSGTGATTSVTLSADHVASIAVLTPGNNYTQFATGSILNPSLTGSPNPAPTPAVVTFTATTNTYGTTPALYYQVWAGIVTDKAIQMQINTVLTYFRSLGYTITPQSNPNAINALQWKITW